MSIWKGQRTYPAHATGEGNANPKNWDHRDGRIANRFIPEAALVSGVNTQCVYNPHKESAERFAYKWRIDACEDIENFLWHRTLFISHHPMRRIILISDRRWNMVAIFLDGLEAGTVKIEESVRKEMLEWYISQPVFIQKLCRQSMLDAGMMLDSHILGEMSTVA